MKHDYKNDLLKIKNNLRYRKDNEIRKKALMLITVLEFGNIARACRKHGYCKQTFYRYCKILRENNFNLELLKKKKTRDYIHPKKTPAHIEDLCIKLRGPYKLSGRIVAPLLKKRYGISLSHACIDNIFKRRGLVTPTKKKRNPHTKRYSAPNSLDRVQVDSVELGIKDNFGNKVKAISFIDDCSRLASLHVCHEKSAHEAGTALKKFINLYGKPVLVQTDNGTEFTNIHSSLLNSKRKKPPSLSYFDTILQDHNIKHSLIRIGTPELNGKIERFHRTLKNPFLDRLDGKSMQEIKYHINQFLELYNKERVHSSINYLTPYEVFIKKKIV